MTSTSFKKEWRLCFLCKQPFGAAHHQISGEPLLKAIKPHLPFHRKDDLLGKTKIRICCRHFEAGHPFYMNERAKLRYLKKEDVFNIKGAPLYSCKKRPAIEISPENSLILPEEPSNPSLLSASSSPIPSISQEQTVFNLKKCETSRTTLHANSPEITKLNIYINGFFNHSSDSNARLIASALTDVKKRLKTDGLEEIDILSLIENINTLVIQNLNMKAICESHEIFQGVQEENWKEKERNLIAEQSKLRAEQERLISSSKSKWTLEAIADRNELFFWTGFPSKTELREQVIHQLITRSEVRPGERSIQKNVGVTIEDRCTWVFMILWRDLSIRELYSLVFKSKEYFGAYPSFVALIKNTAKLMGNNAHRHIKWPSVLEWREMNHSPFSPDFSYHDRLFFIFDGTSIVISKPKNRTMNRATHVHYKGHQAYRVMIVTTLDGTIVYVSELFPGVVPDDVMFNQIDFNRILSDIYGNEERFGYLGDKGFVGIRPPIGWVLLLTKSADLEITNPSNQTIVPTLESILSGGTENTSLPEDTEGITSTDVAKPRGIVEVSIGKTKRFRKLTTGHIRSVDDPQFVQNLVYIAVYTANLMIQKKICLKNSDDPILQASRLSQSEDENSSSIEQQGTGQRRVMPKNRFSQKPIQTSSQIEINSPGGLSSSSAGGNTRGAQTTSSSSFGHSDSSDVSGSSSSSGQSIRSHQ